MIIFDLLCTEQHRFEGWFASSDDFDDQQARGLLACPVCGIGDVTKLPSAKIARPESVPETPAVNPAKRLKAFIEHVILNTEDVGERFADEARRIHREEAAQRAIRGTASREDAEALVDEGIPVMPLPIPPRGDWH